MCLIPALTALLVQQGVTASGGSVVKNPPANAGDMGLNPESGRSSGEGNGSPLQDSCLGNPMDRGVWWGYGPWCGKRVGHDLATKTTAKLLHDTDQTKFKMTSFPSQQSIGHDIPAFQTLLASWAWTEDKPFSEALTGSLHVSHASTPPHTPPFPDPSPAGLTLLWGIWVGSAGQFLQSRGIKLLPDGIQQLVQGNFNRIL